MPVGRSNPSRSLRLALLAPDLVEAILGGWADQRVMLERLERPLPVGWEEQRPSDCPVRFGHGEPLGPPCSPPPRTSAARRPLMVSR